jgi:hypothetical protein
LRGFVEAFAHPLAQVEGLGDEVLAAWDFSQGIDGSSVIDVLEASCRGDSRLTYQLGGCAEPAHNILKDARNRPLETVSTQATAESNRSHGKHCPSVALGQENGRNFMVRDLLWHHSSPDVFQI